MRVCRGCWWQEWCRDALLWDIDGGSEGRYASRLRRDWTRCRFSLTLSLYHAHSAEVNAEPCSAGLFPVPNTKSSGDLLLSASRLRCGPRGRPVSPLRHRVTLCCDQRRRWKKMTLPLPIITAKIVTLHLIFSQVAWSGTSLHVIGLLHPDVWS